MKKLISICIYAKLENSFIADGIVYAEYHNLDLNIKSPLIFLPKSGNTSIIIQSNIDGSCLTIKLIHEMF